MWFEQAASFEQGWMSWTPFLWLVSVYSAYLILYHNVFFIPILPFEIAFWCITTDVILWNLTAQLPSSTQTGIYFASWGESQWSMQWLPLGKGKGRIHDSFREDRFLLRGGSTTPSTTGDPPPGPNPRL